MVPAAPAKDGEVLGTFGLFHPTPRTPTEGELQWIEDAANIAVNRHQRGSVLQFATLSPSYGSVGLQHYRSRAVELDNHLWRDLAGNWRAPGARQRSGVMVSQRAPGALVRGAKARAAMASRPMADLEPPAGDQLREAADRTSEDVVRELVGGKAWLSA